MESGIYYIKNLKNGKLYIGSAKNFKKRWKQHISDLKNNKHCNIILQRSFNKNKKDLSLYEFDIIEKCVYIKNTITKRENFYIKLYDAKNKKYGYNIADATFGDVISNHPNKKNISLRISNTLKRKINALTESERRKKYGRVGALNGRWKNNIKTKKCPICNNTFRLHKTWCSQKCWVVHLNKNVDSLRCAENNPFYNKRHSKETIKKLSETAKNRGYKGSQNIPFMIGNLKFKSLGEANKKMNIHTTTICYRLKSKNKKFSDYYYI